MASYTTPTLQSLIDEALDLLYRPDERPLQVTLGSDDLTALVTDTTCTVSDASLLNPTDLLECGQELLLITAKSSDAVPILTVARGYLQTPVSAHTSGSTVLKAPEWSRYAVRRAILRGLRSAITARVPYLQTTTLTPVTNQQYLPVPAITLQVQRVGLFVTNTGVTRWVDLSQWEYYEDMPTSVVSTGKMITVPRGLPQGSLIQVTYQAPYAWSGGTEDPAEAETVSMAYGSEDLPCLYAAAFLLGGREISRLELDKVEEWNRDDALRTGTNMKTVQFRWQEFYRRCDEVKRVQNVPKHRPYRRMRGVWQAQGWIPGR